MPSTARYSRRWPCRTGRSSSGPTATCTESAPYQQVSRPRSARPDIVRGQRALVADVQPPAAHDRVRPARKTLIGDPEAPFLLVASGAGLGQPNHIVFTLDVQVAVGVGERAFPDAPIPPHHLAGRELEAGQDRVVEA